MPLPLLQTLPKIIKFIGSHVAQVQRYEQLTAHFACRAFCNIQKAVKLSIGAPFKPFGDIGHHRNGRSPNLITEAKILLEIPPPTNSIHS